MYTPRLQGGGGGLGEKEFAGGTRGWGLGAKLQGHTSLVYYFQLSSSQGD